MNPNIINKDFFTGWNRIEDHSIDLILTDPPYGILHDVQSWDVVPDIVNMEIIFDKLLKPTGQVVMFSDLNLLLEILAGFVNHLQFRFYMIWEKTGGMPISKNRPIPNTEFILVFRKKGTLEKDLCWNPKEMGEKGEPYIKRNYDKDIPIRKGQKLDINQNTNGWRHPKTIIKAPNKPNLEKCERTSHPTQKPEILLRKLIRCFSSSGETVFDPFAGSGSTLASAYKESRKSIGFEIEKIYFTEAKRRIETLTAQEVLF